MSDDLKNSLKQLETYVQEENKIKKKEQIKFERDLKKMEYQRNFPLNKIIFFTVAVVGGFIYGGENLTPVLVKYAPKPVAEHYAAAVKQKDIYVDQYIKKVDAVKNTKAPTASPEQAIGETAPSQTQPSTDAARGVANQGASAQPEWVQIDRKWYRKTPDNIYIVNGKKILYIENRNRVPAPQKAEGESAAQE